MSPRRPAVALALALLSLSGAACGKLGPPVRSAPAAAPAAAPAQEAADADREAEEEAEDPR